jgi:hypothetical protein
MKKNIKRPTLKEIRDVLNKIPETTLDRCSIAFDRCMTDSCDDQFKVVFLDEEENYGKHREALENDKDDILGMFTNKLNQDLEQAKKEENQNGYDEEYNLEGDW